MGFVSIKEGGVRHLPYWSVGHARQARWWLSGVQEAEHSASFTEPCRRFTQPRGRTPADHGGVVGDVIRTSRGLPHSTGRLPWDSCRSDWRRHGQGFSLLDSLVTYCQTLEAQRESHSQAEEFVRQGFNLVCTVFTLE